MLNAGKTKPAVQVVDGETSCFTYGPDLAEATKELLESGDVFGTYHLMNEGAVTWYEGVLELYRQAGITIPVEPVTPDAYPRPAKRPAFSVLMNTKRPKLRHYSEALTEFLKEV
jgi:dTDP-4-dehydrorhamnose reductase